MTGALSTTSTVAIRNGGLTSIRDVSFAQILLKNSQIEQLRKSRSGAYSVI
jgi:hypothetical protein